jgi:Flp pilus assembly secretin CpaC
MIGKISALAAAIFVAAMTTSRAERASVSRQSIVLTPGQASIVRLDRSFKTIIAGEEEPGKIIRFQVLDDTTVAITPLQPGQTNLVFLDERNTQVAVVNVSVQYGGGRVRIHNKALIGSHTNYRCWESGCAYVSETTMQEPAALPRGHNSYTSDIKSEVKTDGGPAPTVVTPSR